MEYRYLTKQYDAAIASIIRCNLKANALDIPGTAYFDASLDSLSEYYSRPGRAYFVLLDGGAVLGGGGLAEHSEGVCELQKLYLADSAKGKGFGYALMRLIEAKAIELDYSRIYIETHTNLKAAIRLYERMGYTVIPRPSSAVHGTMNQFYIKTLLREDPDEKKPLPKVLP